MFISSMCTPSQAACRSFFSRPASSSASLKASTMRSPALMSQRSPNLVQPMPRIQTLSLIPVAISLHLLDRWNRFPEVVGDISLGIVKLQTEAEVERVADRDIIDRAIGEVHNRSSAAIEGDR